MNDPQDPPSVATSAMLVGEEWTTQHRLGETGWRVESNGQQGKLVTDKGITAVYRYGPITADEAWLLKWGYEEGFAHGARQVGNRIKTVLGIE